MTVRRGFTLIEMVTSLVILSVLLLACGSIVKMATKATDDSATHNPAQLPAAEAAAAMADDLNVATNFTQRTATSVTFTVPDRLGVGSPQAVVYSWTGVAGDPLLRKFNTGQPTAILAGVRNLKFDYATRTVGTADPAEQTIFDHHTTSGTLKDFALSNTSWASQQFTPNLPSGTSTYSLTRVRVKLKAGAQDAVMSVSVRPSDASGRPTGSVLAQSTVYVSSLSTDYEWLDVPITGLSGLSPSQNLCVVLGYVSGSTNIGSLQYDQALLTILASANWSTSSNAGTTWSAGSLLSTASMTVYATVP